MPLIALDDVGRLIQQHPRYSFFQRDSLEVFPPTTHRVIRGLGIKHVWQLLTFSTRELVDEMMSNTFGPGIQKALEDIAEILVPLGLNIRENTPYALRTADSTPRYIKTVSENTNTLVQFYEDTTYYWTRWAAFREASRLAPTFPRAQVIFRSESLKLGHVTLRP